MRPRIPAYVGFHGQEWQIVECDARWPGGPLERTSYELESEYLELAGDQLVWTTTVVYVRLPEPPQFPASVAVEWESESRARIQHGYRPLRYSGSLVLASRFDADHRPGLIFTLVMNAISHVHILDDTYPHLDELRAALPRAGFARGERIQIGGATFSTVTTQLSLRARDTGRRLLDLPIASLLETLDLGDTPIEDISAIRRARFLTDVDLSGTPIRDLAPLAALGRLRGLDLTNARNVVDLSPLADLAELRTLRLAGTAVTDFTPIAGLALTEVTLPDGVGPAIYQAFADLVEVDVTNRPHARLAPEMPAVRELRAAHSGIRDLSPLAVATELVRVDVSHTQVASLAPLARCRRLAHLDITETPVTRVMGLRDCPLDELIATRSKIDDISCAPPAWSGMRTLRLGATRVGPIEDLRSMTMLRELDISHLDQPDLEFIAGARKLKVLAIPHTGISNLDPIPRCLLEQLDIRWSLVRSFAALQPHIWTLRELALDVEQIHMLGQLQNMLITRVIIEGRNRGDELERAATGWLAGIKYLESIEIIDCMLVELDSVACFDKLERLVIPATTAADAIARFRVARPSVVIELT